MGRSKEQLIALLKKSSVKMKTQEKELKEATIKIQEFIDAAAAPPADATAAPAAAPTWENDKVALEKENHTLSCEIAELRNQLSASTDQNSELETRMGATQEQMEQLQDANQALTDRLQAVQAEATAWEAKAGDCKRMLDNLRERKLTLQQEYDAQTSTNGATVAGLQEQLKEMQARSAADDG
jgi:chromosome segregation ATPase